MLAVDQFIAMVRGAALCNPPTLWNTYQCAFQALTEQVSGDFVECGTFAGAQCAVMARVLMEAKSSRKVHLFDSFEGIPEAGPNDDESITGCIGKGSGQGRLVSTGVSACSVAQVQANMRNWGVDASLLVYHPGWFQHTVPSAAIDRIAVLRLDGDLYESTRVCLMGLYPKLSHGGWCIIDDYALTGCHKAVGEYLASIGETPKIEVIPGGGGPVFWRHT